MFRNLCRSVLGRATAAGAILAGASVALAGAASAAPPAHAARTVQPAGAAAQSINDFNNATICSGANLCMTANGTTGDAVFGKVFAGGTNQQLGLHGAFVCSSGASDHVGGSSGTESCPFQANTGLNTFYKGDEIVTLQRSNSPAYCLVGGISVFDLYQKTCGSTNYLWVLEGALSLGGGKLINVGDSSGFGSSDGVIACTNGTDNAMVLSDYLDYSGRQACQFFT